MAPDAVKVVEDPVHIDTSEPPLVAGRGLTLTVTTAVLLHPELVPVTVYVVIIVGLAVTLVPVEADSPTAGDHTYVVPPLPVNVVDEPEQMVTSAPPLIAGTELTLTVTVAALLPQLFVPVTV